MNVSDNATGDTGSLRRFKLVFPEQQLATNDLDSDLKSDIRRFFRPSNGTWWRSTIIWGLYAVPFGTNGDKAVPADYTGDGAIDLAVFVQAIKLGIFLIQPTILIMVFHLVY